MRTPALAIVLALCCVLAGCNTFAPGADPQQPVPSVTPAEVPGDTTDAPPRRGGDRLAPGLTTTGFGVRSDLYRAHRALLENRTVRVGRQSVQTYRGRVVSNVSEETRIGADRERLIVEADNDRSPASALTAYGQFSNGSATLDRRVVGDVVRYSDSGGTMSAGPRLQSRLEDLRDLLYRVEFTGVEHVGAREGRALYRVTGSDPQAREYPDGSGDAGVRPEVTLLVDERGFVHSTRTVEEVRRPARLVNTSEEETGASVTVTVAERTTFASGGGSFTVPDWVEEGFERIAGREYVVPGVTADGLVDTDRLARAHERVVANESVRIERRYVEREGGTVVSERRVTAAANRTTGERYVAERYGQRNLTTTSWANDSGGYRRVVDGSGTSYDELTEVRVGGFLSVRLPSNARFGETDVEALDDGRYRLTVTEIPVADDDTLYHDRVSFVVDDRGFVSAYDATLVGAGHERRQTTSVTVTTGPTSVERPDWLDAAKNATT
ncbi:hypothetical protein ACFPYI_08065 [Halomarina salina]|uniref:Outer membrane lipoprotein-sorting protein n=1 Tax=Halomarina salina TaxID=1872699 RepID=A0ABD5RLT3_9EURY|nr:hypothetical protein [Halomarina salina]